MSVKIGYLNENYASSYQVLTNDDVLTLNSFYNSNVIILNNSKNALADVFINYKNVMKTGISSNTYIIHDLSSNMELITANTSNILLNTDVSITGHIDVNRILSTSNDTLMINSNVSIYLPEPRDSFAVRTSNEISSVNFTTNNFSIQNIAQENVFSIDSSAMNIDKDVYINQGTLYVNAISGIGPNLLIENAKYSSTYIESMNATKQLAVLNSETDGDFTSFVINKEYGIKDLLSINTCNTTISGNKFLTNYLTLNNNGQMGLNTTSPDAYLSLRKNTNSTVNNIITYKGDLTGDVFKLTKSGDIGIGVSNPTAQLHIMRNDEGVQNQLRKNPIVKIEMIYSGSNNYSNIYNNFTTSLKNPTTGGDSTKITLFQKVTENVVNFDTSIKNELYLLNSNVLQNIGYNLGNIGQIVLPNPNTIILDDLSIPSSIDNTNYTISTSITYPASDNIVLYVNTPLINTDNGFSFEYNCIMMSKTTSDTGGYKFDTTLPGYNASNFISIPDINNNQYLYKKNIKQNIEIKIAFLIEKNNRNNLNILEISYPINYTYTQTILVPAPDILSISSNNTFISSISANGTLSLGSKMPATLANNKYLLYTSGDAFIKGLNISSIYTDVSTCNISFLNTNLTNINKLKSTMIESDNMNIGYFQSSNASMTNANISNLSFTNCSNSYLNLSSGNAIFNTKLTFSPTIFNDNICEIIVNSNVSRTTGTYHRNNGIVLTNKGNDLNPCFSIQTATALSKPYFQMHNSESGYLFRLNKSISTTNFQLTNDYISPNKSTYFNFEENTPTLFEHIKEFNVLSFGEQNLICMDCTNYRAESGAPDNYIYTNYDSKMCIGLPHKQISAMGYSKRNATYFKDQIVNDPARNYLLNIFGNVCIADIDDNPIFTTKTTYNVGDPTPIRRCGINGHPDPDYDLCIYGNLRSSNITVMNDISIKNENDFINVKNLLIQLQADITTLRSDVNTLMGI